MKKDKRFRVILVDDRDARTFIDGARLVDVAPRVHPVVFDLRHYGRRVVKAALFERIFGNDGGPYGWVRRDFECLWAPWCAPRS